MTLQIRQADGDLVFKVRVSAGARRNETRGVYDGAVKVAVTPVAEKGKANNAVLALLADVLGVSKGQLAIVSGKSSNVKSIRVGGIDTKSIAKRLAELADG